MHYNDSNRGIAHLRLGTSVAGLADVGTVDAYNAGTQKNMVDQVTSVSVSSDALYWFEVKTATKNAASTGYRFDWQYIAFARSA
jgi:hypothetical protein